VTVYGAAFERPSCYRRGIVVGEYGGRRIEVKQRTEQQAMAPWVAKAARAPAPTVSEAPSGGLFFARETGLALGMLSRLRANFGGGSS
jgi:hypothetical protein